MQRELYNLLGENTPPIAVFEGPKLKDKPSWKQKASPWSWAEFKNSARSDGLVLHHWIKGKFDVDPEEDYSFAKYNKRLSIPRFTKEDYDIALKDDEWSYEETKYLFYLCDVYELRWVVIHDRYHFPRQKLLKDENVKVEGEAKENAVAEIPKPVTRTIEDLKARFYDIGQRLIKLKQQRGEHIGAAEEELYKQMKFNKENEIKRKQHLERLLSRNPAEIAEEEALVLESRKLEAAAELMLKERAEILRLLDAPNCNNSKIAQYQTSQGLAQLTNTLLLSDKNKKRKDTPNTPLSGSPPPQPDVQRGTQEKSSTKAQPAKRTTTAVNSATTSGNTTPAESTKAPVKTKKKDKEASKKGASAGAAAVATAIQRKLSPQEEQAYGITYHDKIPSGVYLRSSKIATYKQALQAKMDQALAELGIPSRPVMPTGKVCAKFDSLQHSISVLLEAKKQADKLETEIQIIRAQKSGNAHPLKNVGTPTHTSLQTQSQLQAQKQLQSQSQSHQQTQLQQHQSKQQQPQPQPLQSQSQSQSQSQTQTQTQPQTQTQSKSQTPLQSLQSQSQSNSQSPAQTQSQNSPSN